MKTATEIKRLEGFTGDARLYKLSDPMGYDFDWDTDELQKETDHVIVSATVALFTGLETYIFPADAEGKIANWGELPGSYRGGLDHATALRGAGYEIVK